MDGYVFPDAVVVSDDDFAFDVRRVGEILWRCTQNGPVADGVVVTECDFSVQNGIGLDRASRAHFYLTSDDDVWADLNVV